MAARQFQSWGGHYVNKSATGREFQGWDRFFRIFKASAVAGRIMSSLVRHGGLAGARRVSGTRRRVSWMTDYTVGDTINKRFTTRAFATGVPTTLAGSPVVSAYEDASTTEITAGITLGVDHDGKAGLNLLTIVATGANGFESGKDYDLVITTGTVGGVSVIGEVVEHFTLGRSAAAVDLANGTDGLGAIKAETAIITADVVNIDGAAMRGTDNAFLAASAPTNFSSMSITAGGLVDITQAAADKVWGSASRTLTAFSTALAVSVWDVLEAAIVTASSIGLKVKNNLDAVLTARTLPTAGYFDPTTDIVANVTLVDTTTENTDMRGTDNAALASVLGALVDVAAAGDPTSADTIMQYMKQLINTLEGTVGIPVYPAAADPANNVSLAEAIRAIRDDVTGLAGSVMRGTDSAALASVATEARLAELDAGNLPTDVAAVKSDTVDMQGAGFVTGTDSLEAIRDRGDAAWITGAGGSDRLLLADTTIATLATQVSFTLTAGSADDNAYNNCTDHDFSCPALSTE